MRILDNFWYGDLAPCEQFVKQDEEYFGALRKAVEQKEKILSNMDPELQTTVEILLGLQTDVSVIGEKKAFIHGFRLGVRLAVEAFTGM